MNLDAGPVLFGFACLVAIFFAGALYRVHGRLQVARRVNADLQVRLHDSEVRFDQLEQALRKLRRTEARDRVLGIIESNRSF